MISGSLFSVTFLELGQAATGSKCLHLSKVSQPSVLVTSNGDTWVAFWQDFVHFINVFWFQPQ